MQQAVCVRRKIKSKKKKITEKSAPPKTHDETHSSPATACNSRRHAMDPYSRDSIDPGFVEIGLVHLSQSVKTTNVTHTQTHMPTDKLNKMAPCTHPGMKRLFCLKLKAQNGLITRTTAAAVTSIINNSRFIFFVFIFFGITQRSLHFRP